MESGMIDFVLISLSFFFLLIISSFVYLFSKKIKLPYTILLFLVGLLLVPLSRIDIFSWITGFKLTPEILFFVFLPILVFESAYNIKYKELLKNGITIFSLAVVGLLLSTFLIGFLLYYLFNFIGFNIPLGVTILFGALISATDPVAVLSLFKSIGAPRRLSLIFEGESLFNDGTSLAVFLIILSILTEFSKGNGFNLGGSILEGIFLFLSMVAGGILFGLFMGFLFSQILGKIKNVQEVEITLTMVLAHVTFLLSELISYYTEHWGFIHIPISGIIATAIAGLVVGNYGKYKITPKVEEYMDIFWSYFAWLVNSLVFILMGLILANIKVNFLSFLPLIFLTIGVVIIVRGISVYLPLGILSKLKIEEPVPMNWQHLLAWGSLRGALAIMMVLMIPDNLTLPGWNFNFSIKDFLIALVISSVMFTLIVKALTIIPLLKKLKIDKMNSIEQFEYYEGSILAFLKMLSKLDENYKLGYLLEEEYKELKYKYENKLNKVLNEMNKFLKKEKSVSDLIKRAISLHALGIEKQYLKTLFVSNELDENNYRVLLGKIERQKDRLERGLPQFKYESDFSYDEKNIFEKFIEKIFDKDSIENKYIRNRARIIIINHVISELENLKNTQFSFDKKYFDDVINMYKKLLNIAKEKNNNLLEKHKATIMGLEVKLSEKTLLRIEEGVINKLFNKEIITPKLYNKFIEEIDYNIYKK